jgi:hypothetical protein
MAVFFTHGCGLVKEALQFVLLASLSSIVLSPTSLTLWPAAGRARHALGGLHTWSYMAANSCHPVSALVVHTLASSNCSIAGAPCVDEDEDEDEVERLEQKYGLLSRRLS